MQNRKTKMILALTALLLTGGMTLQAGHHGFNEARAIYAKEVREAQAALLPRWSRHDKTAKDKAAGWYMRTRVAATAEDGTVYEHNSAGVFGELLQSRNGKDRHDIPAYGPATLQVVFPHYNWKKGNAGDYWSDYRKYNKKRKNRRRVWTFLIRNQKSVDLSNADIQIKLDDAKMIDFRRVKGNVHYTERGTNPKMKNRFTLVDVDNHQTYSVDELSYANLSMDGKHTRTFRWVRGPVRPRDFRPLKMPK